MEKKDMSNEEYEESMRDNVSRLSELLEKKESLESEILSTRESIEILMRTYNRDTFDDDSFPVTVTFKLQSTGERMKSGAKNILRNLLTPVQWKQVYHEPEEVQRLVVRKRK